MSQFFHPEFFFKRRVCLNIFKKQSAMANYTYWKMFVPKFTNILKYLYINSRQQTKNVTKNIFLRDFWEPC